MTITTIIPVRNGGDGFRRCLEAILQSDRPADQILVVDDGSTDDSANLAQSLGVQILRLVPAGGVPLGPAAARNRAARDAWGDVLMFIDADVVIRPDALGLVERSLRADAGVVALFGSYDDNPPGPGIVARYKNLLHHHTHQNARTEATTFWAGCGAIRRRTFEAIGGFDDRYTRPSVEDIELGLRLSSNGQRISCVPSIQATHLKRWTLAGMIKTDIFQRAIPWSRLILQSGSLPNDLNLDTKNRISALSAGVIAACLPLTLIWPIIASLVAGAALVVVLSCNAGLIRLLYRRGGCSLAVGGVALHILFLLYSSATFAAMLASDRLGRLSQAIRRTPEAIRRVLQTT